MKYFNHIANPIICISASEKFRYEARYIICCGNVETETEQTGDGDLEAYRESKRMSIANPHMRNSVAPPNVRNSPNMAAPPPAYNMRPSIASNRSTGPGYKAPVINMPSNRTGVSLSPLNSHRKVSPPGGANGNANSSNLDSKMEGNIVINNSDSGIKYKTTSSPSSRNNNTTNNSSHFTVDPSLNSRSTESSSAGHEHSTLLKDPDTSNIVSDLKEE